MSKILCLSNDELFERIKNGRYHIVPQGDMIDKSFRTLPTIREEKPFEYETVYIVTQDTHLGEK